MFTISRISDFQAIFNYLLRHPWDRKSRKHLFPVPELFVAEVDPDLLLEIQGP